MDVLARSTLVALGMPGWLVDFKPFTLTHLVVVVVAVTITVTLIRLRRPLGATAAGRRFDRALGVVGLANWLLYQGYGLYWVANYWESPDPGKYTLEYALPLQICDLASIIGPIAWLTNKRWMSVLLYFWGIGLSSQAFVTPTVQAGPGTAEFWFFFIAHLVIVGGAFYETFARGFRPTWRDYGFAAALSIAYLVVILPLDLALDFNIGYMGRPQPGDPKTLVDALGPWPLRVVWMTLLGLGIMALTMVPWMVVTKRERDSLPPEVSR